MTRRLTIGKLARAAGVNAETVRYYERCGLLPEPARSESGYRLYTENGLERLRFIRGAKALGFSLDEIGHLLAVVDRGGDRAEVRALAAERLAGMDERIAAMEAARGILSGLVAACSGHGSVRDCPIIEAVNDPPTPTGDGESP